MYQPKKKIIKAHKKGKLEVSLRRDIKSMGDLSLVYTPGVAEISKIIAKNPKRLRDLTIKGNSVAIVTDGSSVLGLGNIGPRAALPVMEGKAAIFKKFAGIDAFPICLDTQDPRKIIETVKIIAPVFGAVNLEDITAPKCFEIEDGLQDIGIPVFHDDQHGAAIAVHAALINAAKVLSKKFEDFTVVISGAGAAGFSIAKFLSCVGFKGTQCSKVKDIIVVDSKGIIHKKRKGLPRYKRKLATFTNKTNKKGGLAQAMIDADVFIGVSTGGIVTKRMVRIMASDSIVLALANPVPEIYPSDARAAGASIFGSGRSDFANQVNNALVFPGIFKGALQAQVPRITNKMKFAAAHALASSVKRPTKQKILPSMFDKTLVNHIARAVQRAA